MMHTAASSKAFVLFSDPYAFAVLVYWTGHVQRLSVSLQFIHSVCRDVFLVKITKIGFSTGEMFSSVSPSTKSMESILHFMESILKSMESIPQSMESIPHFMEPILKKYGVHPPVHGIHPPFHGIHLKKVWSPSPSPVLYTPPQIPYGLHMDSTWNPSGLQMELIHGLCLV